MQRANEFESKRQIAKIDKPLDRKEWGMTPPTVNAYYSGSFNEIVFPAGILQPPFFDKNMDDAVNFGGIGLVIGHELTHGFDDQGRKFDPQGNLRDWWTEQDGKEFEKRVSCVADEYSNFVAVDDMKLNGRLTLGENTADNGGARIALMALEHMIADDKTGKEGQKIDGYTPEQRFFLGFGRVWCEKQRPEYLRDAGQHRSALAGEISRGRRGAEHAGVPESLGLQGRPADGGGERLPRVVKCQARDSRSGSFASDRRVLRVARLAENRFCADMSTTHSCTEIDHVDGWLRQRRLRPRWLGSTRLRSVAPRPAAMPEAR